MRIGLMVGCLLMLAGVAMCSAGEPPQTSRNAELPGPPVQAILREAGEIALKQDAQEHYWAGNVLLDISKLQIRAGDFEGALRSIRSSGDASSRRFELIHLAEALARDGKRERAADVLSLLNPDDGCGSDYLKD